ncbi:MAG TPA: hypothetical protein VND42_04010 [Candidatus Acidoferrales bacterium]|nr:hypothetical protein [Candidatus Acidoferrales bacterium]
MKLEGFSLHPAPLRRIRWRVAKTEGPLWAVFKRAGEFFLDALWRKREENTSSFAWTKCRHGGLPVQKTAAKIRVLLPKNCNGKLGIGQGNSSSWMRHIPFRNRWLGGSFVLRVRKRQIGKNTLKGRIPDVHITG